jgi:hypothetical protein
VRPLNLTHRGELTRLGFLVPETGSIRPRSPETRNSGPDSRTLRAAGIPTRDTSCFRISPSTPASDASTTEHSPSSMSYPVGSSPRTLAPRTAHTTLPSRARRLREVGPSTSSAANTAARSLSLRRPHPGEGNGIRGTRRKAGSVSGGASSE